MPIQWLGLGISTSEIDESEPIRVPNTPSSISMSTIELNHAHAHKIRETKSDSCPVHESIRYTFPTCGALSDLSRVMATVY